MEERYTVAACMILEREGRVLLCRRIDPDTPELDGLWELPGGRVEPGEQPDEALRREAREEIGVRLTGWQLFHAFTFDFPGAGHFLMLCYQAATDDQPRPVAEVSETRWLEPPDALARLRYPRVRETIARYVALRAPTSGKAPSGGPHGTS